MKWTNEQLKNLSPATKQRNPHLFGVVGGLPDPIIEQNPIPALDSGKKAHRRGSRCVALCVTIISVRRRTIDYANLVGGCKGLQDAIAKTLGVDDADPCVEWEFRQIKTTGRKGTIVNIQKL